MRLGFYILGILLTIAGLIYNCAGYAPIGVALTCIGVLVTIMTAKKHLASIRAGRTVTVLRIVRPSSTTSRTPLYTTQGGGFATSKNGRYVWHSHIPSSLNAKEGDPVPEDWEVFAVNEAAWREVHVRDNSSE